VIELTTYQKPAIVWGYKGLSISFVISEGVMPRFGRDPEVCDLIETVHDKISKKFTGICFEVYRITKSGSTDVQQDPTSIKPAPPALEDLQSN